MIFFAVGFFVKQTLWAPVIPPKIFLDWGLEFTKIFKFKTIPHAFGKHEQFCFVYSVSMQGCILCNGQRHRVSLRVAGKYPQYKSIQWFIRTSFGMLFSQRYTCMTFLTSGFFLSNESPDSYPKFVSNIKLVLLKCFNLKLIRHIRRTHRMIFCHDRVN